VADNRRQYLVDNDVVLPGIRKVTGDLDVTVIGENCGTTPTIKTVAAPLSGTEYSYSLPAGTKRFTVRARQGVARLRIAFIATATNGTDYWTVRAGSSLPEQCVNSTTTYIVYFQSTKANTDVEFLSWA
jgi:hypothetical protein